MRAFQQVDVFTDELMFGNPVAVVHNADGLTTEQMAAFARWTNLSETTFLLPATDPAADYRLRIFTPVQELPFAGHPTLGTARAWLEAGGTPARGAELVQECAAGLVRVRRDGLRLAFAAPPVLRSGPVDDGELEELLRALRLDAGDVIAARWADNGPGWVALLLRDADTVLCIEPDRGAFGALDKVGVVGAYPAGSGVEFEVRAFVPRVGLGEDPVTGSLNASIAQWLIPAGLAPERYTAGQGTRLGRRGRIHVERVGDDIWVGGDTVVGVSGTVAL
ncbi:MAG TPA: PhzF family phenazine biosynthesis protein [Pseudonocardia sp.]|nr:PhzF family phenazine biosynthesis protein [Pseudonocardia sp.]